MELGGKLPRDRGGRYNVLLIKRENKKAILGRPMERVRTRREKGGGVKVQTEVNNLGGLVHFFSRGVRDGGMNKGGMDGCIRKANLERHDCLGLPLILSERKNLRQAKKRKDGGGREGGKERIVRGGEEGRDKYLRLQCLGDTGRYSECYLTSGANTLPHGLQAKRKIRRGSEV